MLSNEPLADFDLKHLGSVCVQGALSDAKPILDAGQEQLQGLSGPDPSVSAVVFYVSSLLSKAQADFAGFYKNRQVPVHSPPCLPSMRCPSWVSDCSVRCLPCCLWRTCGQAAFCKHQAIIFMCCCSLMYLSYVASDSLPAEFKLRLAVDVSLAALLGERKWAFCFCLSQLLATPSYYIMFISPTPRWAICLHGGEVNEALRRLYY